VLDPSLYPAPSPEQLVAQYQGRTASDWAVELQDSDLYRAQAASKALAELGEPGFQQLVAGLESRSWETRLLCLKAFTREHMLQQGELAFGSLVHLLQDPHPAIRQAAIVRIGWHREQGGPALPRLRTISQSDPDEENRRLAAEVIVGLNESVSGYTALLRDSHPDVRREAAARLGLMGRDAINALQPLSQLAAADPDARVQATAANAIELIRLASRK
jgi:HEAT repeat protein